MISIRQKISQIACLLSASKASVKFLVESFLYFEFVV